MTLTGTDFKRRVHFGMGRPAPLFGLLLASCISPVQLTLVDAGTTDGLDAAHIADASIDAKSQDAGTDVSHPPDADRDGGTQPDADRHDARICRVRATEPPGVTAFGMNERFMLFENGPAGTTLFQGQYYWFDDDPSTPQWTTWGSLADLIADAPAVEGRKPWDDQGITAVYWDHIETVLISHDRYWHHNGYRFDESGHVRDLFPPSPPTVDGQLPWEGEGITGYALRAWSEGLVISGQRYYEYSSLRWIRGGHVADRFPDLPAIEGTLPGDPPGISALFEHDGLYTLVHGDFYWEIDSADALVATGRISERWPNVPAFEVPCP